MDPVVAFFMMQALLEDDEEEILLYELFRRNKIRSNLIEPLTLQYQSWELSKSQIDNEMWVDQFCAEEFLSHFRMNTDCFNLLVQFVAEDGRLIHGYRGGFEPIRLEKKVQIAIWFLAHEESMLKIGDRFGVTKSTVYSILMEFCKVMHSQFIRWPERESCEEISNKFKEISGMPGVIGAIDCTHIPVKVPKGRQENYTGRSLRHSVVLQGVCTAEKLFTNVSIGQHEERQKILVNSWLNKTVTVEGATRLFYQKYHLVGDSDYTCKDWLIVPFKDNGTLSLEQKKFNFNLNQTHMVVKSAFRLLKGRWKRLQYLNVGNILNASKIIMACCALHNFCLNNHVPELEEGLDVDSPCEHDFLSESELSGDVQGFTKRLSIMANL